MDRITDTINPIENEINVLVGKGEKRKAIDLLTQVSNIGIKEAEGVIVTWNNLPHLNKLLVLSK